MAKARKVDIVRGYGSFLDPNHVEVELTTGDAQDKTGERRSSASSSASSPPARPRCTCPSSRRTRASSIPPARSNCVSCRTRCSSSAAASSASRWPPCIRRWRPHRRGRDAGWPDAGPGPRRGQGVGEAERPALRQHHAQDQNVGVEAKEDGLYVTFEGDKAPQATALRHDPAVGRAQPQRQQDRRRQGRRDRR